MINQKRHVIFIIKLAVQRVPQPSLAFPRYSGSILTVTLIQGYFPADQPRTAQNAGRNGPRRRDHPVGRPLSRPFDGDSGAPRRWNPGGSAARRDPAALRTGRLCGRPGGDDGRRPRRHP